MATILEDTLEAADQSYVEGLREVHGLISVRKTYTPKSPGDRAPGWCHTKRGEWTFMFEAMSDGRYKLAISHISMPWEVGRRYWHIWSKEPTADMVAYRGCKLIDRASIYVVLNS